MNAGVPTALVYLPPVKMSKKSVRGCSTDAIFLLITDVPTGNDTYYSALLPRSYHYQIVLAVLGLLVGYSTVDTEGERQMSGDTVPRKRFKIKSNKRGSQFFCEMIPVEKLWLQDVCYEHCA